MNQPLKNGNINGFDTTLSIGGLRCCPSIFYSIKKLRYTAARLFYSFVLKLHHTLPEYLLDFMLIIPSVYYAVVKIGSGLPPSAVVKIESGLFVVLLAAPPIERCAFCFLKVKLLCYLTFPANLDFLFPLVVFYRIAQFDWLW